MISSRRCYVTVLLVQSAPLVQSGAASDFGSRLFAVARSSLLLCKDIVRIAQPLQFGIYI